jgi:hypothetical protein
MRGRGLVICAWPIPIFVPLENMLWIKCRKEH